MSEVLLVTNPVNVSYLTGFDGSFGWALYDVGSGEVFLITDARYAGYVDKTVNDGVVVGGLKLRPMEVLKNRIVELGVKKLAFEAGHMTYEKLDVFRDNNKGIEFVGKKDVIEKMRVVKSDKELDLIKQSQEKCGEIFEVVKSELKIGMSEKDVAWLIKELAYEAGCDDLSFDSIVAFGENSAVPHHRSSERVLVKGDVVLIDMGVVWQGYCSDMTRVLFTDSPTDRQREVYECVLRANKKALEAVVEGVGCVKLDGVARGVISEAGLGDEFCHSLGHGVGLEVHEKPALSPRSEGELSAGMVVTIEPGIYLEGEFGVRIEDLVVVEKNGVRNLTSVSKELEVIDI